MLTSHIIRVAVEAALAEDAPYGDITCETTIPADETGSAHLTARENGVMSGVPPPVPEPDEEPSSPGWEGSAGSVFTVSSRITRSASAGSSTMS